VIVTIRHEIEIAASSASVYSFFEHIEENYTKWHPDHVVFRWIKGDGLAEGSVAYSEQRMRGKVHGLPARFTKVVPAKRVEFELTNPIARFFAPRYLWLFEATEGGCRFVAEGDVRLGRISSRLRHVQEALAAGRKHLAEEGENLKRLVEAGATDGSQ
jgi:uncharacterized protein YndB with AHSA1/START domain